MTQPYYFKKKAHQKLLLPYKPAFNQLSAFFLVVEKRTLVDHVTTLINGNASLFTKVKSALALYICIHVVMSMGIIHACAVAIGSYLLMKQFNRICDHSGYFKPMYSCRKNPALKPIRCRIPRTLPGISVVVSLYYVHASNHVPEYSTYACS